MAQNYNIFNSRRVLFGILSYFYELFHVGCCVSGQIILELFLFKLILIQNFNYFVEYENTCLTFNGWTKSDCICLNFINRCVKKLSISVLYFECFLFIEFLPSVVKSGSLWCNLLMTSFFIFDPCRYGSFWQIHVDWIRQALWLTGLFYFVEYRNMLGWNVIPHSVVFDLFCWINL